VNEETSRDESLCARSVRRFDSNTASTQQRNVIGCGSVKLCYPEKTEFAGIQIALCVRYEIGSGSIILSKLLVMSVDVLMLNYCPL